MTRPTSFAMLVGVAVSIALPVLAEAQGARRGSSSGRGGAAVARSAPAPRPRPAAAQGVSRPRTTRAVSGVAAPRRAVVTGPGRVVYPVHAYRPYYPARGYYPYYGAYYPYPAYYPWGFYPGFGFSLGFSSYGFSWGVGIGWPAYGVVPPYAPYYYGYPYRYGHPYGAGVPYASGGARPASSSPDRMDTEIEVEGAAAPQARNVRTGSLRVRANPATARIYVNGALAGLVKEFDGLTGHLQLAEGTYELELRAEGYGRYVTQLSVAAGRTVTLRASLARIPPVAGW